MNPGGYHLTNVLLHAIVAVLAYYVARRLLRASGVVEPNARTARALLPCALAALAFALHPLRVESVAWVTERRDVLSELFCLASLLLYLKACDSQPPRPRYLLLSIGTFALALLSKATVVTLPFVLLLLDVYPLRRLTALDGWWSRSAARVYAEKMPYALLAAAAAALSVVALPPRPQLGVASKIAVSAYGLCFYLWKTLVPFNLSPLYPMPPHVDAVDVRFVLCSLLIAAIFVVVFALRRRWPGLVVGWLVFVIVTLPLLGIVQNGPQIAADRYTYHAGLALSILAAGAFALLPVRSRSLSTSTAAGVLMLFAVLTWRQVHVWHDSKGFWSYVLAQEPQSALANGSLADQIIATSPDEALALYDRAVGIDPTDPEGENRYGAALSRLGHVEEAIAHLRNALRLNRGDRGVSSGDRDRSFARRRSIRLGKCAVQATRFCRSGDALPIGATASARRRGHQVEPVDCGRDIATFGAAMSEWNRSCRALA